MTSSWKFVPCRIVYPDGTESWDVRSFYFSEEEGPLGWSQEAVTPYGESLEDLKSELSRIVEDLENENVLTLYVYRCQKCGCEDARTERSRTLCEGCLKVPDNS